MGETLVSRPRKHQPQLAVVIGMEHMRGNTPTPNLTLTLTLTLTLNLSNPHLTLTLTLTPTLTPALTLIPTLSPTFTLTRRLRPVRRVLPHAVVTHPARLPHRPPPQHHRVRHSGLEPQPTADPRRTPD